jgi:hypothetical protein
MLPWVIKFVLERDGRRAIPLEPSGPRATGRGASTSLILGLNVWPNPTCVMARSEWPDCRAGSDAMEGSAPEPVVTGRPAQLEGCQTRGYPPTGLRVRQKTGDAFRAYLLPWHRGGKGACHASS